MATEIRTIILRTAGTNCDKETSFAFERAGSSTELVHINRLVSGSVSLDRYHILAIPGGFTYGDDIASGKILANELIFKMGDEIRRFISQGKLIIGICNGFQVLVKAGILPGLGDESDRIQSTLTLNDSDKFEERWVHLKPSSGRCIWTKGFDRVIELPIAHGEGKFLPSSESIRKKLKRADLIAFTYSDASGHRASYPANPNGSVDDIAGICDPTGRIFGLMPHPERHIMATQHPAWTRMAHGKHAGDGLGIFINGVRFAKKYL